MFSEVLFGCFSRLSEAVSVDLPRFPEVHFVGFLRFVDVIFHCFLKFSDVLFVSFPRLSEVLFVGFHKLSDIFCRFSYVFRSYFCRFSHVFCQRQGMSRMSVQARFRKRNAMRKLKTNKQNKGHLPTPLFRVPPPPHQKVTAQTRRSHDSCPKPSGLPSAPRKTYKKSLGEPRTTYTSNIGKLRNPTKRTSES